MADSPNARVLSGGWDIGRADLTAAPLLVVLSNHQFLGRDATLSPVVLSNQHS